MEKVKSAYDCLKYDVLKLIFEVLNCFDELANRPRMNDMVGTKFSETH